MAPLTRTHFVKPNWPTCHCEDLPLILSPSKDHPELVEGRGNLVEVEHTSTNRCCYGYEIANPRIEYGGTMTDKVGSHEAVAQVADSASDIAIYGK